MKIWTVGHSTRTDGEFKEILAAHRIGLVVDVRMFPSSRRYPQFNKPALSASLAELGIEYRHEPRLGGRRTPRQDSHNTAWQNASFRAYADHMETPEFKAGVEELLELSNETRTAIMCAEAVWWRCHRGLISDWLKAEGHEVEHIIAAKKIEAHPFTSGRGSSKGSCRIADC